MSTTMTGLVVATAALAALMGGAFFAFSSFVMRALRDLAPEEGARAMQAINVRAVSPAFMIGLFGTAAASLIVGWMAITRWEGAQAGFALAGAATYLLGIFVMTAVFHVPRNNRLAGVDAATDEGRAHWATYLRQWTLGNHVRTLAGLSAAVLLMISMAVA